MSSVYSKSLQIYNAEQFKSSVDSASEPYLYFTLGRVTPWANDSNPVQANTSVVSGNDVWKNMLGAKQIQGNDVRLAIRRNDWTAGTVYNEYNDTVDLMQQMNNPNVKFYVVTDEWNVYKCLSNASGAISNVKPTSILTNASVETADKYIWKYMYTLTDEERLRFVTEDFIPVKTLRENNGSLQWQVQENAVPGAIEAIDVVSRGTLFSNSNIVTITGDGSGATASIVTGANGAIDRIVITDKGAGYTVANVSITTTGGGPAGIGGEVRAVISPPGGHGSDPLEELGGSYVMINVRLRNTENGVLDVQNEFRQVAIIKNPTLRNTKNVATGLAYSQTFTLFMDNSGASNYQEDEIVFQGSSVATATFKGTVASWNPDTSVLELINTQGNPTTDILTGDTTKVSRFVSSFVDKDMEPYSGEILYIDNIIPIQRAVDQTEDFKIAISF